jgi:hypothetical protein
MLEQKQNVENFFNNVETSFSTFLVIFSTTFYKLFQHFLVQHFFPNIFLSNIFSFFPNSSIFTSGFRRREARARARCHGAELAAPAMAAAVARGANGEPDGARAGSQWPVHWTLCYLL